jgi:hypothetical protein
MSRLFLNIGRGTYLNKYKIDQIIRWEFDIITKKPAHYEIFVNGSKSGDKNLTHKIYGNEPEYDHISHFLKTESETLPNYRDYAERGQVFPF